MTGVRWRPGPSDTNRVMIMIACGLLLVAGLAAVCLRGGERFRLPTDNTDGGALLPHVARRVLWWANVLLLSGAVAGLCMAGAGGRLIMRLLAMTSPEDDSRFTENGEVIGKITLGGTGFFVAVLGVVVGMITALLYGLVRHWLPAGRAGGAAFGLLLLLVLSTVLDPLRPDNRDFQIVGPGWLSVAAFSALAIAHGMLLAVAVAWLSQRVPLIGTMKDLLWYIPLPLVLVLLGAASVLPVAGIIAAIGVVWAAAALRRQFHTEESQIPAATGQLSPLVVTAGRPSQPAETGAGAAQVPPTGQLEQRRARRDRRILLAGRIALLVLAVAWLPGFVTSMAAIVAAGSP
jgi:hypothetical protein